MKQIFITSFNKFKKALTYDVICDKVRLHVRAGSSLLTISMFVVLDAADGSYIRTLCVRHQVWPNRDRILCVVDEVDDFLDRDKLVFNICSNKNNVFDKPTLER